jgi:hypothetical protein
VNNAFFGKIKEWGVLVAFIIGLATLANFGLGVLNAYIITNISPINAKIDAVSAAEIRNESEHDNLATKTEVANLSSKVTSIDNNVQAIMRFFAIKGLQK